MGYKNHNQPEKATEWADKMSKLYKLPGIVLKFLDKRNQQQGQETQVTTS
jgi:hypothetical protein